MNKGRADHPDKFKKVRGIRGTKFHQFLTCILKFSNLKESVRDILLDPHHIRLYEQAFTHPTAHSTCNYEYLEFLGDLTLNKCIPWVLSRRYPELCHPKGVKILSRLKIQLVSKQVFAGLAHRLHFLPFISSDAYTQQYELDDLLEDVFEAFFGATECILDNHFQIGAGYTACYAMIERFMHTIPISLKYKDLYDSKTRLKELFDVFHDQIGTIKYTSNKVEKDRPVFQVVVSRISPEGTRIEMGHGEHHIKIEAEKIAAEIAITRLNSEGYVKAVPDFYRKIEEAAAANSNK